MRGSIGFQHQCALLVGYYAETRVDSSPSHLRLFHEHPSKTMPPKSVNSKKAAAMEKKAANEVRA